MIDVKYKIHAFYIFLILVSIIIILATVKWGEIPLLIQYITFALTLTSLVLALLAIVYAFYSNSSTSLNISRLDGSSQSIVKAAENIVNATTLINDQINTLPVHFQHVEGKVEETQSLIKEYYAKQTASPILKESPSPAPISTKLAEAFIINSSHAGLIIIYACILSFQQKKPFSLHTLCETTNVSIFDYAYGYYVASNAFGILQGKTKDKIITIKSVNETVIANTKDDLIRRADKWSSGKDDFLKDVTAIESFFNKMSIAS